MGYQLESLCRLRIRVDVRVQFARELAISLLDLVLTCGTRDA
jgi:hypothetical protein